MKKKEAESIRRRVGQELESNVMWKFWVADRYWLCPYCGLVGAHVTDPAKRVERVALHLAGQCPAWNDFKGDLVQRSVLEQGRLEVFVGHQLTHEPEWHRFDDEGRWYCPYCARGTRVEGLRTHEGIRRLRRAIAEHLHGCKAYDNGEGPQLADEVLVEQVRLETRCHRLGDQIASRIETQAVWLARHGDSWWCCPYCQMRVHDIDLSSPTTRRHSAPIEMARHLVHDCPVYADLPPVPDQPSHILKPVPADALTRLIETFEEPDEEEAAPIETDTGPPIGGPPETGDRRETLL